MTSTGRGKMCGRVRRLKFSLKNVFEKFSKAKIDEKGMMLKFAQIETMLIEFLDSGLPYC